MPLTYLSTENTRLLLQCLLTRKQELERRNAVLRTEAAAAASDPAMLAKIELKVDIFRAIVLWQMNERTSYNRGRFWQCKACLTPFLAGDSGIPWQETPCTGCGRLVGGHKNIPNDNTQSIPYPYSDEAQGDSKEEMATKLAAAFRDQLLERERERTAEGKSEES
jgi:hypothetical protein